MSSELNREEQQAFIEGVIERIDKEVTQSIDFMNNVSRVGTLSLVLQRLSSMGDQLKQQGIEKINLEEPLIIPVRQIRDVSPRAVGTPEQIAQFRDRRTEIAAAQLAPHLLEVLLQERGIQSSQLRSLSQEQAQQLALPIVESISDLGTQLFDVMEEFEGDARIGEHDFRDSEGIDISPLGLRATLVRQLPSDTDRVLAHEKQGFTVQLHEIDQFRLQRLKLIGIDLQLMPKMRPQAQTLLSGVKLDPIFHPPSVK